MKKLLTLAAVFFCGQVFGTPISVTDVYHFLDHRGANDAGIAPGIRLQFGANRVVPNGGAGTSNPAQASQTNAVTGNIMKRNLQWTPFSTNPNQYIGTAADDPGLRGAWQLSFSNGPHTAGIATPSVGNLNPLPFVQNVTLDWDSTPSVSWSTGSYTPDAVAIRIRDNGSNVRPIGTPIANLFYVEYAPGNQTTFDLPTQLLSAGNGYSLEIDMVDFRSGSFIQGIGNAGGRINSMFTDTVNQSRAFFNFTPLAAGAPANIFLPTATFLPDGSPAYQFSISNVGPTQTIFIDPLVAIGYDYLIGEGNPKFKTVTLPVAIGDRVYELWLWDGSEFVDSGISIEGGVPYSFGPDGVSRFRILGIEPDAGLSPFDSTAFITGLTFMEDGDFTGRMIPLTIEIGEVPEPGTLVLILAALVAVSTSLQRFKAPRAVFGCSTTPRP